MPTSRPKRPVPSRRTSPSIPEYSAIIASPDTSSSRARRRQIGPKPADASNTTPTTAALGPSITVWSSCLTHRAPPCARPTSAMPPSTPATWSAAIAATVRAQPRRRSANGNSANVATLVAR
jgi:hypothetical protein